MLDEYVYVTRTYAKRVFGGSIRRAQSSLKEIGLRDPGEITEDATSAVCREVRKAPDPL
jgi:hypothetical protein